MSPSRRGHRLRAVVLVLLPLLLATGCTGLPEDGPVVDSGSRSTVDDQRASDINAVPPTPGMSASAVVNGFLDAMYASPIRLDVAQQFLTPGAAEAWDPEAGTITYLERQQARDSGLRVSVQLIDTERLDRTGAYDDTSSSGDETLDLDLRIVDGEYRIDDPPDALVVPRTWFTQRFRRASLFFFDPSGRILVPQPVYVPRGNELPATLVRRLVQISGDASPLVRSYVPSGVDSRADVSVSPEGVADIDLGGEPVTLGDATSERLLAQLAWTLRQQSSIRRIRVTVGGSVVLAPDGGELFDVRDADRYSPNGDDPSTDLYAVRDRRLQRRDGNELVPVAGAFGDGSTPVGVATPSIDGRRAAVVAPGGRSLLLGDLAGTGSDDGGDDAGPQDPGTVLRGTSLVAPAWDFADRLWVVDRTRRGGVVRAVVHLVVAGRDREIEVDGVSGRDVTHLLVSRDGTRLVAVVRARGGDELRVARIETDGLGAVVRVRPSRRIDPDPGTALGIDDVAWTSPTTLAVLTPIGPDRVYGVRRIGVDGSPSSVETLPTPVTGTVLGLAGSPVTTLPLYVVTRDNLVDLTEGGTYGFVGKPASSVFYAG